MTKLDELSKVDYYSLATMSNHKGLFGVCDRFRDRFAVVGSRTYMSPAVLGKS